MELFQYSQIKVKNAVWHGCALRLYVVMIHFKPVQQHFKKREFMLSHSTLINNVESFYSLLKDCHSYTNAILKYCSDPFKMK